ncbi:ATP-binding protein [Candidatus Saccharibacteria bacterium]|nr:ATP-binding protein [Candidatus Saccharibacteria bacterium]
MKYTHRIIEPQLIKMIGNFPAVMILGPRQVGKSTLLEFSTRQKKIQGEYVSLDDPVLAGQANANPELFLGSYGRPLVVDEFQYAKNLTSYAKIEIDKARSAALFDKADNLGTIFFLTGSRVFDTLERVRESLAGRVGIIKLYSYSAREIEGVPGSAFSPIYDDVKIRKPTKHLGEKAFYERVLRGGYPELWLNPNLDTKQFFSSYIQTYIERDVRKEIQPENEYNFIRFVSLLAARTSQELVVEHLAGELGIDGKTANKWLSILRSTGIVYLLQPYYNNVTKRIAKRPKIYFTDTALACYLAGYPTVEGLMNSDYKGKIFETYVFSEILKSYVNDNIDIDKDIYYYRRNDKQESDLLIRIRDMYYPIEIKSSDHAKPGDTTWFSDLDKIGLKRGNGLVVCRASMLAPITDNSYAVPVEYI